MPSSDTENKHVAKQWYDNIKPSVVVDIGAGKGTYSKLCRQAGSHWVAIEAWAPYIHEFDLKKHYDQIIVSDIRYTDFYAIHRCPNLVIIGDVLEHLKKEEARQVIAKLRAWAEHIIISVPMLHRDQDARAGNWFEVHRDHWHHAEMVEELGESLIKTKKGCILAYYLVKGI